MPAIAGRIPTPFSCGPAELSHIMAVNSEKPGGAIRSNIESTPQKRKLRSETSPMLENPMDLSARRKSPRLRVNASLHNTPANGNEKGSDEIEMKLYKLPEKRLLDSFNAKSKWNPKDSEQMREVKEALHVSVAPPTIVCREDEQKRVLEFCKACIEQEKAGSLYVCGCPGTGKSLSMEKVKEILVDWTREADFQQPDVLSITCTSLTNTSDIFTKILGRNQTQKKTNGSISSLQQLQSMYSQKTSSASLNMTMIIADELDYLITKDRAVLHDLFMLTTFPFSRCVLIGIANAIDLADRFLPRLKSLNCQPIVVTFRAYSKDQILRILQERLSELPYTVFQQQALELCARKVAAASGDMRKALCVCRSAIEMLEAEMRESTRHSNSLSEETAFIEHTTPAPNNVKKQEIDVIRIDHMAIALSKTYQSPVVDTIQNLPHHQQILLCSAVKLFCGGKKDTTLWELNKSYMNFCKSERVPPAGILELSSMCRVLHDQGLLKLGQSRDDKLRRVQLKADEADITFALQGIRFFRNCLQ
ncbi:Cell division control protein [Quillaja saponaria]|uniref:Cell division control protein n=1 Tax=Quillaja saponaria TaxID=32244 RepID=A0AAD7PQ68_QUISA|nr:Cell division control protein [Quillaja saponaria]